MASHNVHVAAAKAGCEIRGEPFAVQRGHCGSAQRKMSMNCATELLLQYRSQNPLSPPRTAVRAAAVGLHMRLADVLRRGVLPAGAGASAAATTATLYDANPSIAVSRIVS